MAGPAARPDGIAHQEFARHDEQDREGEDRLAAAVERHEPSSPKCVDDSNQQIRKQARRNPADKA